MAYIGTQPKDVRSFGKADFSFTATQGQTAFTGADDNNKTLGFTEGQISVYVNGILMDTADYTVSNNNTVTLASATNLNDMVSIVALQTDIPNSNYVPATGGTFTGDVTFEGAFTSQGIDDNATSTAMRIDSSGNLLVGKTSTDNAATTGLEVRSTGYTAIARDGADVLSLNRLTSDGNIMNFRKDGTTVGSIASRLGVVSSIILDPRTGGAGLTGGGPGAIIPTGNTGASTDGAADLGSSTGRWKNLYLSGGVYLGGTGAANKLDDVEEGSLAISGTNISSGTMYYQKVNKFVFISGIVVYATSSSTSNAELPSLPFVVGNESTERGSLNVGYQNVNSTYGLSGLPSANTTFALWRKDGGNIATYAEVSGKTIYFSGTYVTDA